MAPDHGDPMKLVYTIAGGLSLIFLFIRPSTIEDPNSMGSLLSYLQPTERKVLIRSDVNLLEQSCPWGYEYEKIVNLGLGLGLNLPSI